MKILYFDCGMGAAGDMLSSALLELLPDADAFLAKVNSLKPQDALVLREASEKCGVYGTHLKVLAHGVEEDEELHQHAQAHVGHHHDSIDCDGNGSQHEHSHNHEHHHDHDIEEHHHHTHASLDGIREMVTCFDLPSEVKQDILDIYGLIADAEAKVHQKTISDIHFHEVGTIDAIIDITMACMLIHEIAPDLIVASPVCTGSGTVRCAHGILPVPAPATAEILMGIPTNAGYFESELCTPTGAAILRHFVSKYGKMPEMTVSKIGYGMGKKDFARANCVRAFLGESTEANTDIVELSCNVDDMTAEEIGFAMERLFEAGAVDVYTTSIGMKKNRPAVKLTAMCKEQNKQAVIDCFFLHTTTIGIREALFIRHTLERSMETQEKNGFSFRKKLSSGFGVCREKIEFDDLAEYAKEKHVSLWQARKELSE